MSMTSVEPEETPPSQSELLSPAPVPSALSTLELESDTERAAQPSETSRITLEPAGDGWALIALIPHDGDEPPASVSEGLALAVWVRGHGHVASVDPGPGRRSAADRVG